MLWQPYSRHTPLDHSKRTVPQDQFTVAQGFIRITLLSHCSTLMHAIGQYLIENKIYCLQSVVVI